MFCIIVAYNVYEYMCVCMSVVKLCRHGSKLGGKCVFLSPQMQRC